MDSITIRGLDDRLKRRLRILAAQHGRSVEEEAKAILGEGIGEKPTNNLCDAVRSEVKAYGGVELELPPRRPVRNPPDFEEMLKDK